MARVGRPALYNNCLDFEAAIEIYFETCDEGEEREAWNPKKAIMERWKEPVPYTWPDLARSLGFVSRQSLNDYEVRGEFSDSVKRARLRVEGQRNRQLISGQGNPAGRIFDLKNNFGWVDRHETAQDTTIRVIWDADSLAPIEAAQLEVIDAGPVVPELPGVE